ncbi:MAG: hypothetical protein KAJ53_02785, partial [Anaerolineales bacterium]|nr:hypothetical protein [Anaerolineales bacterium]
LEEALVDYLRYKETLLLLDNCEHIIDACAQLAETLLQACPQLEILATSREGLAIPGEVTYQVPSLSLHAKESPSPEELFSSEAVHLFSERARAANPSFELTPDNAPIIADICRRLDGIPLAIELAASRTAFLSVSQIAARLHDRFRLLSGGSRTALPRQQTLQALIDWSWNLLSEDEQRLLRRLSVFAGGWGLSAAEAIAATESSIDVFELLTQLVRKSLVVVENIQSRTVRYRLLESIRLYAFDHLLEADEVATLRDSHAEYYTNLVLAAEEQMRGPEMLPWITILHQEIDNLRAAIEWSLESRPVLALRFAGAIVVLRVAIFSAKEGRPWVEDAIRNAETAPPDLDEAEYKRLLAHAYATLSGISLATGNNSNAYAYAQTAVSFARELDDTLLLAVGLRLVSLGSIFSGDLETADATMQESLDISRKHGYIYEIALSYVSILGINLYMERIEQPQSYIEEYQQVVRKVKNPWITASYTSFAGRMAANSGDLDEGRTQFEHSIDLFLQLGDRHFANATRSDLGHIYREHGQNEAAEEIYTETIREWFELGHHPAVAHQLECFAFLSIAQDEHKRAARLLGASEAIRKNANAARSLGEEEQFQDAVEFLRNELGDDVYLQDFREGKAFPIEGAVAYALQREADLST